jgi:glycosyltransferase involved in cell wall biosynthesis
MRILIHAPNVSSGGGGVLLRQLLSSLPPEHSYSLHLDKRFVYEILPSSINCIKTVPPSFFARLILEISLILDVKKFDLVLCFGNLPPFSKLNIPVFLLIQNRFLVDKAAPMVFPWKIKLRLYIERLILNYFSKNVDHFLVQTKSMNLLLVQLGIAKTDRISTISFFSPALINVRPKDLKGKKYNFVYPASSDWHKNHLSLVAAWVNLAETGIFPSLALTLDPKIKENFWILETIKKYKLNISLLGEIHDSEMTSLYHRSEALIYPSLVESFGLPLLEASSMGIPIVASDLEYVWDVCSPKFVFNPSDPKSIARNVKRQLMIPIHPSKVVNMTDLVETILSKV